MTALIAPVSSLHLWINGPHQSKQKSLYLKYPIGVLLLRTYFSIFIPQTILLPNMPLHLSFQGSSSTGNTPQYITLTITYYTNTFNSFL